MKMPQARPDPEANRRADIQGLRAIAVLAVIVYHSGVTADGGFIGVDIFFVISGYVIARSLARELAATGRVSLPRFYLRRVRRLFPALAAMVITVELFGMLLGPASSTHMSGLTGIFAALFSANLYLAQLPTGYFDVSTQLDPLLHTWTLAVEEQFYLVFPIVLALAWRLRRGSFAAVSVGALGVASFLLATHGHPLSVTAQLPRSPFDYYGAPPRAWEFAAGALLALAPFRLPRVAAGSLSATALGLVVLLVGVPTPDSSLLVVAVAPVAAACMLLAAGATPNLISSLLSLRPMTWIGDLSYSLYLWHWPLIVFARATFPNSSSAAPLAAAATIIPAYLSYRFVESPLRYSPTIRTAAVLRVVFAGMAIAIAAAGIALKWPLVTPRAYAAQQHLDAKDGCDNRAPLGAPALHQCVWGSGAHGTIALVGDSNAGQYTEPVIAAGEADGYKVEIATGHGCPFVRLAIGSRDDPTGEQIRGCLGYETATINDLVKTRPNLVIIGERTDDWLDSAYAFGPPEATQPTIRDRQGQMTLWASALRSDLERLQRAHVPVLLITPLPAMPSDIGSCATLLLLRNRCRGEVSRTKADSELAEATTTERIATRNLTHVKLVDLSSHVCNRTVCLSDRNGLEMFYDAKHLSVAGARTLTPTFKTLIRDNARG